MDIKKVTNCFSSVWLLFSNLCKLVYAVRKLRLQFDHLTFDLLEIFNFFRHQDPCVALLNKILNALKASVAAEIMLIRRSGPDALLKLTHQFN
jgi:hypothetical protein